MFSRVAIAKQKQIHIDEENMKKKYFLLHKWDFIKEKRREFETVVKDLKKKR